MEKNENQTVSEMTSDPVKTEKKSSPEKSGSLVKKGLSLSILTLFSRVLGLVREMTKARFLGTTGFSDAFSVAFQLPNLFRRLFAENSISVAFIPTFKNYLEKSDTPEGKKETQDFISATFTLLSFLVVIFVILCMIFTPALLHLYYGIKNIEDPAEFSESIILTRMMFPYLAIISAAAFFQGILNGLKIFSPSGFTPILFNGIVIAATYILAPHMANPARAMAIGVIAGGLVQALFQLPFVLKNKWSISFTSLKKAFSNPGTRRVLRLIAPTIIGMAAYQVNDLISTAIAKRLGSGVVSSLQYSLRLQELILGICAVTIGTVILPDLTGFARDERWDKFNNMLSQSIKLITLICIPVTVYCLIMGENIITLLFNAGLFDDDSIRSTMGVFQFHIIGLLFIAVNRIISPAFYSRGDTKSPTYAGLASVAIDIILAVSLSFFMGGNGVALALTIASAANTVLLFILLLRSKNIDSKQVVGSTLMYALRMLVFSIPAGAAAFFAKAPLVAFFAKTGPAGSLLAHKDEFCHCFLRCRMVTQGLPVLITGIIFAVIGILLLVVTKDPLIKSLARKIKK